MARRANALWQDRVDSMSSMVAVTNTTAGQALVLAKPQTFMNRSGTAARRLIEFLNLPSSHVLVVYDDMDLPFGSLRLRERGSAGTHNGMRSVVKALGPDIARLRVGIGQSPPGAATDHVLSEFAPAEAPAVEALIERAADAATDWAERGAVAAMNQYNKA
jgi:PTH1 family peptidyl-tRNA hydrolase